MIGILLGFVIGILLSLVIGILLVFVIGTLLHFGIVQHFVLRTLQYSSGPTENLATLHRCDLLLKQ